MRLLWGTFLFGAGSGVLPMLNMEVYLGLVAARAHSPNLLALAVVGSLGQNLGKLAWYYAARGVLHVPWLTRRLEDPKRKAALERWQARVQGRTGRSGLLAFISAAVGVPPFFVVAALAGSLRMNVVMFFVSGLVGRVIFFWLLLSGATLLIH